MAAPAPTYQRLTRNSAGAGTYSSLWLADEHVLIVRSSGYHESYARLQLSDMKAIFLTKTDRRLWWGLFWGIIAGCSGIVIFVLLLRGQTPIGSAILFATGLTGFLWNHFLGEGCRAFVITGVQTAELPSLVRMRKGRKFIARLQPLILQAQAGLAQAPAVPSAAAEQLPITSEPTAAPLQPKSESPLAG